MIAAARQTTTDGRRNDWASGWRGLLLWGAPISILLAASGLPERYLVVIWPVVLTFMGAACLANARRCGRVHCYATGPFFLILAAVALLYGLGAIPLGRNGWNTLGIILLAGSIVLCCFPEWVFGRYRSSRLRVAREPGRSGGSPETQ
jgi:hypothetical protein